MDYEYLVVLVTAPSMDVGKQIAADLLEKRLAACVNFLPSVFSMYVWKGEIHEDHEVLLTIKTRLDLFETRLIPAIKTIHPYVTPEIIALPIVNGSVDYLSWIRDVTSSALR